MCTSYAIVVTLRYPSAQVVFLIEDMCIDQVSHDNLFGVVVLEVGSRVDGQDGCRHTWTFSYCTWTKIFEK